MTYQVRAEDRERERAWRVIDDEAVAPLPVPGKRTLSEALPPGEPGVIQAKAAAGGMPASARPAITALFGSPGGGQPLPAEVRTKMERSLGADFADVRVHEGPEAAAIGARAYARGNHLFFAPGQYDPASEAGQRLLGHELTHVVQQRAGTAKGGQGAGLAVNRDPGLEAEADRAGEHAARGDRAEIAGGTRGASATGDTLQGDFFDDLLVLMAAYYIFRTHAILSDEARSAHGRIISERALEDSERRYGALRKARSDANQLADAAANAAQIARRAAAEDRDADAASEDATRAAEAARRAAVEAAETDVEDTKGAELAATHARKHAALAIAAACHAVALVASGHAQTAKSAARTAKSESEDGAKAAATASAEASEQEALSAEQQARAVASADNLKAASEALTRAIEHAKNAGEHARAASAQIAQVNKHAEAAKAQIKGANGASEALDSGAVAELDADRNNLAATAPDAMRDAKQAIHAARQDAGEARDGAKRDAQDAAKHVTTAEDHASAASAAAKRASSEVIAQVRAAISAQREAALNAQKQTRPFGKRASDVREVAPLIERGNACVATLNSLLELVVTAGLDDLHQLLERAFKARGEIEGVVGELQAACVRYDAQAMVKAAKALDDQLVVQIKSVDTVVASADAALSEARAAMKLATQALERAAELQGTAGEMMSHITLDDDQVVGKTKTIDQLIQQADETIAQAREHFRTAELKAKEAEATASSVPNKAALHGERAEIAASDKTLSRGPKQVDVSAERKQLASHDASVEHSMEELAKRRSAASKIGREAKDDQATIAKTDKSALALGKLGHDTVTAQGVALTEEAGERAGELAKRIKALWSTASDINITVTHVAPKQLESVASNANEPTTSTAKSGQQSLTTAKEAYAGLVDQLKRTDAGYLKLKQLLGDLEDDGSLTTTTAALARAMQLNKQLGQDVDLAGVTAAEAKAALREIEDYVRAHQPDRREQPKERDLSEFCVEDVEPPIDAKQLEWYAQAYARIRLDRVLDPANLTKRAVPTLDRTRFFSDLMELTYLGRGVDQGAFVQVGRMTAAALRDALATRPALKLHLDEFDAGAKGDAVRFADYKLCYEADGVLWFENRVEVAQHKRSVEAKPLDEVTKHSKKFVPLDDALRGAANQLSGYTADGGTDAQGHQPEAPPSGHNRTLKINIQLPNATKPHDLTEYIARINAIMAEKAGNGRGAEFHLAVQQIEITWSSGATKAARTFVRNGTKYEVR